MKTNPIVLGLPRFGSTIDMQKVCSKCQFEKQARHPFFQDRTVNTRPLEVVHINVWGLTKAKSLAGSSYYVTFINDYP